MNTYFARSSKDNGFSMADQGMQVHPTDLIEIQLWIEEHDWLFTLFKSEQNTAPKFHFPDLVSACVSLICMHADASERIFAFMGTQLVLRPRHESRRRVSMWGAQYQLLQALQRSKANRHPYPRFQLDQLTTACVALSRQADSTGTSVLQQARINMANRSVIRTEVSLSN
jgi:hypothetical protein